MDVKNKKGIWEVLRQHQLPDNRLIYSLSGLLDDEIEKFNSIWVNLPNDLQAQLMAKLRDITEADFAVDFQAIFQLGIDSEYPDICIPAMEGLTENDDIRLLPRFYSLLQEHKDENVRIAAAQALAIFVLQGELGKLPENIFHKTVSLLIQSFSKPDETIDVKRRILEAIAYTGIDKVPQFIENAYNSSDEKMRISAVFSMGRSADKRWAEQVTKELFNTNPEMRFEATRACGELQLKDAVSELEELADDTDKQVQEMALWALGQIGGTQARRILEKYINSDSELLSSAAQQAIDELDFFQDKLSSFLGPPSEFNGEGEGNWLTPEGFPFDDDEEDDELLDPDWFEEE